MTEDLIVKVKIEKKTKQDSGIHDAICDAYNAQHAAIVMSSSRDVIEMVDDLLNAGGKEDEKGKISAPVKSMYVRISLSTLLSMSHDIHQECSNGKKAMWSHSGAAPPPV